MEKRHRDNLKALALFLLDSRPDLKFSMEAYIQNEGRSNISTKQDYFKATNECGTICCAVGYMPLIDPTVFEYSRTKLLNWRLICEGFCGLEDHTDNCTWLFSPLWEYADNSRLGTAKRIINFLRVGRPINWEGQLIKKNPFSYNGEF